MGCNPFFKNPKDMKALRMLYSFFAGNHVTPTVTTVETALHPVHEKDILDGSEFMDDQIRTDETEEEETNQ